MHTALRVVDRTLALSLAVAPLGQLLARTSLGSSGAVLFGGVLSLLTAVAVVLYVPRYGGDDAWRFGGYTFLGFVAVSLVAGHGASVALADAPLLGVVVWAVAAGLALGVVERRRTDA